MYAAPLLIPVRRKRDEGRLPIACFTQAVGHRRRHLTRREPVVGRREIVVEVRVVELQERSQVWKIIQMRLHAVAVADAAVGAAAAAAL